MEPGARLLGNRYELLDLLASGGMGRVWRAHDRLLNRRVAVKVLRSEFTGNPAFVARFRAEAQHAAVLSHPHIASVFDYGEVQVDGERLAYLVMELVEGESLADLLLRERRLDVTRTLQVVRATAAALAVAHAAGVVHRDVKPGNVLVARDGTVKITDFGIAWSASSVPLTQTGQVLGTAHYLSPEQAQGAQASPASDVYALGAVAYECLAGHRAFDGESSVQIAVMHIRDEPAPLPPDVPPAVRRLVERAMAKDPAQRFPDGAALRDAVDSVLAGAAPAARGQTGTAVMPVLPPATAPTAVLGGPRPSGGTAGRRMALGAVAALVAVLLATVVAVAVRGGDAGGPAAGTTSSPSATGTAPQEPAPIDLEPADYLGRPVADVQADLVGLGLVPVLQPVQTAEVPDGQVTALGPLTGLAPGTQVTVSHAVAPPPAPPAEGPGDEDGDEEEGNGGGNGNEGGGNGDEGNGNRGRGNGGG